MKYDSRLWRECVPAGFVFGALVGGIAEHEAFTTHIGLFFAGGLFLGIGVYFLLLRLPSWRTEANARAVWVINAGLAWIFLSQTFDIPHYQLALPFVLGAFVVVYDRVRASLATARSGRD